MSVAPDCGACNLCCKLLAVPDINKPRGIMCWNTGFHGGCSRHAEKLTAPDMAACATFECVWLQSQRRENPVERQHPNWRPDHVHVVMGPESPVEEGLLFIHVDPDYPSAWRTEPVSTYLEELLSRGARLHIYIGNVEVALPDEAYDGRRPSSISSEGPPSEGQPN